MSDTMRQYAPFPTVLADLVERLRYRAQEGWSFSLEDIERDHAGVHQGAAGGLTFIILTGDYGGPDGTYRGAMDAYHPLRPRPVYFYFPVPAATYDDRSWTRWLFDRLGDVDRHERMEHFVFEWEEVGGPSAGPGQVTKHTLRPYAPSHGPGNDPYMVREVGTDMDRRTAFTGAVNDD